jgi:hypothetical protein
VNLLARTTVLLVAAALLAWHGMLLAIPHNHADHAISQEQLYCSASHPSSDASHLHAKGQHLSPHPCIACLVGSTVVDAAGSDAFEGVADQGAAEVVASSDHRSRYRSHLPPHRGPPSLV